MEWALASAPASGETHTGDRGLVTSAREGALIAVVDALGHGPEASRVADAAVEAILDGPVDDLPRVVLRCHHELAGSRGAVLALARFEATGILSWLAIGNVRAILMRHRYGRAQACAAATAHAGILGMRLPPVRPSTIAVRPDDVLVMATDGVGGVELSAQRWSDLPAAAAHALNQNRIAADDALVLTARLSRGAEL